MSVDIIKQLERAKRHIEKNQIEDAIAAYQSVLTVAPNHMESIQALGDLHENFIVQGAELILGVHHHRNQRRALNGVTSDELVVLRFECRRYLHESLYGRWNLAVHFSQHNVGGSDAGNHV